MSCELSCMLAGPSQRCLISLTGHFAIDSIQNHCHSTIEVLWRNVVHAVLGKSSQNDARLGSLDSVINLINFTFCLCAMWLTANIVSYDHVILVEVF